MTSHYITSPITTNSTAKYLRIGENEFPITVKKHPTSHKITIRYNPIKKQVLVTIPQAASIKQGLHFADEKKHWIAEQIKQYCNMVYLKNGNIISVLGKNIELKHVGGRGIVTETESVLHIHGEIEFMERRVKKWLEQRLNQEIAMLAGYFSRKLNVKVKNISIKETTSCWGSCSHDGRISFSWRLIFAPYDVLYYIVAHEVSHIKEHNHSVKFWNLVEQLHPEFKRAQKWLKLHGKTLYMYR